MTLPVRVVPPITRRSRIGAFTWGAMVGQILFHYRILDRLDEVGIHRDLKPGDILVTAEGRLKVLSERESSSSAGDRKAYRRYGMGEAMDRDNCVATEQD